MTTHELCTTLFNAADPLITAYRTDLVHDVCTITELAARHGTCPPFIHLTRESGTHLDVLVPASDYPDVGDIVPYLFGHCDRVGLLENAGSSVSYFSKPTSGDVLKVLFWDGETLLDSNLPDAARKVAEYKAQIRSDWEAAR